MAKIGELIAGIEVEKEAAQKREQKARKEIEVILAVAQQEGRSSLSDEEDARCEKLMEAIELSKAQQDGIAQKLARAKAVQAEEADYDARMRREGSDERSSTGPRTTTRTAEFHVGSEPRTYSRETDPTGRMFLSDVVKGFTGDVRSNDRLSRHSREEEVERAGSYAAGVMQERAGVTSASFTGLVVPQYLLDLVAPAVANLRPLADSANRHPLPATGMTVNISRVTTASSAGLQTNQLSTVLNQDMADTLLTANIQTFSGYSLVSRQAIERGAGVEDQMMQDMLRQMYTSLDSTLISQDIAGGRGLLAATIAVDNADSTGTASQTVLYGDIVGAASKSATAVRGVGLPDIVVMHPRRWYWMQAALVSVWPMIGGSATTPAGSASQNNTGGRGAILPCGLSVIADANMPTTGEKVIVGPSSELHLWEDAGAPVFIRAEQPAAAQLGVQLVVYEYAAYTFGRYTGAFQTVSGNTLMAAPAGF